MSYYLNPMNALNRLRNEWIEHNGLIVAVDFDSTMRPYKSYEEADDSELVRNLVRDLYNLGCTIIMWTARAEERHQEAKDWLAQNNIKYHLFNKSVQVKEHAEGRKIYANAYLDDRAGLYEVYMMLKTLVEEFKAKKHMNLVHGIATQLARP